MYIGESFLFCEKILGNFDRMWYRICTTDCLEFGENAIFCAYDGYNQQTIHTFVKVIVLIFAFSGSFAKKKEKKGSKKVF